VDVADQTKVWSNISTRGESYYLKAELQNRGAAYTNADLTGYLWYASNSLSTVGVLIPSYTTETSGVWFYLSATNTLGLSTNAEAYFAQIVLTNTAGNLKYDWRQGTFATRHGGGITGIGTTPTTGIMNWDVITSVGTLPWSGMSATNVTWDNVTGKPFIWPGSATDSTARADASLGITQVVYGAQDGPSVAGRVLTIGTNKFSGGTSGSGTSDHAALSNLAWTASGHTGTPARLAGFFEGGAAGYAGFGAGVYLDGDDNIAVSNDIIAGAAAGATALQPANTSGWVVASHDGLTTFAQATQAAVAVVAPYTNKIDTALSSTGGVMSGSIVWSSTETGPSFSYSRYGFPSSSTLKCLDDFLPYWVDVVNGSTTFVYRLAFTSDIPTTAGQVGAISNTPAGIAAAGIMTNNSFSINGVVVGAGSNVTVAAGATVQTGTNFSCILSRSSEWYVPTNTTAYIPFDSEISDAPNWHTTTGDTTRVYVSTPGLYLISASAAWGMSAAYTATGFYLGINTNGVGIISTADFSGALYLGQTITCAVNLKGTEYIHVSVYHSVNTGTTRFWDQGSGVGGYYPKLTITRLGD
jgi:hypothetical protein